MFHKGNLYYGYECYNYPNIICIFMLTRTIEINYRIVSIWTFNIVNNEALQGHTHSWIYKNKLLQSYGIPVDLYVYQVFTETHNEEENVSSFEW